MHKHYFVDVYGGVEPELVGPVPSENWEDVAKEIRKNQGEDDIIFWLDIEDGKPIIGSFSAGFFEEEE